MHVDDVGQRPQPVQQAEQGLALVPLGERPQEQHRDGGEDDVADGALDEGQPVEAVVEALGHRLLQGDHQGDDGGHHDRHADGPREDGGAVQPDLRGPGRLLHDGDEVGEITRGTGQSAVAEPGADAPFELSDGGPDVLRDELDLVARRAGRRHLSTLWPPTRPDRETAHSALRLPC